MKASSMTAWLLDGGSPMKASSVAVWFLIVCAGGCSNGSSGGPDAGRLEGKKLSDLTLPEREQFCATNHGTFAALAVGSCVLSGVESAASKDACEAARSECETTSASFGVCQGADAAPPDFTDCGALRVSQVESCLGDAKTFFASLDCSAFGQPPSAAPSCLSTLEQNCPALLTPF